MKSHATYFNRGAKPHAAANYRQPNLRGAKGGMLSPDPTAQGQFFSMINQSPYMIAQRKRLDFLANPALHNNAVSTGAALIQGKVPRPSVTIQLGRQPGSPANLSRMVDRAQNATFGHIHPLQLSGAEPNRGNRNPRTILLPKGQGVIQRIPPATATAAAGNAGTRFWAVKPKRDYLKEASILAVQNKGDVEDPNWQARVRFILGGDEAWVGLNDIYPLDSDELEDFPTTAAALGAVKRLVRKGGSGTAMGDVFNTLGVISATSSLVAETEGWYTTGIVAGVGVFLGGTTQIIRALALRDKDAAARAFEGAKGIFNVLSGGLGIAANVLGLKDISEASTATGLFSLDAWMVAELLNIIDQGPGAARDVYDKQATPRLASVVFSIFKIIGGGVMVFGSAFESDPALIPGMVLAGGGTLLGFIFGMIKLAKMAIHHWTKNRPVEQQTGELEEVVVD